MRTILITIIAAALPAWLAFAEQPRQPPKKPSVTQRPANPCAMYGAGFVQVEGTSTCVKIGGSVTVEAGGRAR